MAFIDTHDLESGRLIEADLCIIGAGAAGLTIAHAFIDSPTKVVLLESGGTELDEKTQSLYRGTIVGQSHAPLDVCRFRYYGGTTNQWTAHVRPLDPIDFETRPWVPHSGWPIAPSDLAPYLGRVNARLGLGEDAFDSSLFKKGAAPPPSFVDDRIRTQIRRILPKAMRNFGTLDREALRKATNVDTYLFANVLRIGLNERRDHVAQLEVGTLEGVRVSVRARRYVLAAGGIENPRILLLSSIGAMSVDERQLVGGFFCNHAEGWAGYLLPGAGGFDVRAFVRYQATGGTVAPLLSVAPEVQRERKLLNCWLDPTRLSPSTLKQTVAREATRVTGARGARGRDPAPSDEAVQALVRAMDEEGTGSRPRQPSSLRVYAEATPNPDSRVLLGDDLDAFGQRRTVLDWRLQAAVSDSVRRTLRVFAQELGAAGLARFRSLFPEGGFESIRTVDSHHHMGTTRMHADPKQGVVDRNCRMHGISNLYIAGSSVFPTYGTANPTYTILALAYRLHDHLRETA